MTQVQPEFHMATENGNANIFGTVTDRIEIPTAKLKLWITASSNSCLQTTKTVIDSRKG